MAKQENNRDYSTYTPEALRAQEVMAEYLIENAYDDDTVRGLEILAAVKAAREAQKYGEKI